MTDRFSLKQRLVIYLQENPGLHSKEDVIRVVIAEANYVSRKKYTSDNAVVRLRELERAGIIEVKLIKGLAHHQVKPHDPRGTPRERLLKWSAWACAPVKPEQMHADGKPLTNFDVLPPEKIFARYPQCDAGLQVEQVFAS